MSSRIAVLGCGYWGKNLVRNFYELETLKLVCDQSDSGRINAKDAAPGVEVLSDFQVALERSDIDAVVLATPAETHHPLAISAMAYGKDVFVEKPLAMNYGQGLEMRDVALRNERILMVGHLLEYHPAVLKLREIIESKELGNLNYIYSHRLNFGKIRVEENVLWSFGPHDIAVILRLAGTLPTEVTCSGESYITPGLADVTVACLRFETGLRAHIFVSWLNPFKEQKLVVVGDRKMAVFNDVNKEDKLVIHDQRVDVEERGPVLQKGATATVPLENHEPLRKECEHFLECMRTRQTPLTGVENGIDVLKVLQGCQTSLQLNGRPVQLTDV